MGYKRMIDLNSLDNDFDLGDEDFDTISGMSDIDDDLAGIFGTLLGGSTKKDKTVNNAGQIPPRQRTQKLNINDYNTPQGQQKLVSNLIEKINEIIMRVEMIDAKCDGQTMTMRKMQQQINDIEKNMLP